MLGNTSAIVSRITAPVADTLPSYTNIETGTLLYVVAALQATQTTKQTLEDNSDKLIAATALEALRRDFTTKIGATQWAILIGDAKQWRYAVVDEIQKDREVEDQTDGNSAS